MYFPKDEYDNRWRGVHDGMRKKGYGAALVWGRSAGSYDRCGDVLYLTNFYSGHSAHEYDTPLWQARSYAAVLLEDGQTPELHMDEAGYPEDLLATDRNRWHMDPIKGVIDALKSRKIAGRVALVGSDCLPMKYWLQLEAATPEIHWVPEDKLVLECRRRQSPRELDCLCEGGEIVTRALDILMENLIIGKTEAESVGLAAAEAMKHGGALAYIRCSHGERAQYWSREPISGYSTDPVRDGDMVRAWFMGPMKAGYFLDPGRTTVCGKKPTRAQRDLIEGCAAIVEGIIAAMKPGVKVRDLGKLGFELTKKYGGDIQGATAQWPLFGHRQGMFWDSWIGTDITDEDDVFEAGTACSSEAFLVHDGVGLAGFEQNLIIGESGVEILTKTPMLWW
jgi:Xaa-Pro aminopeptidase